MHQDIENLLSGPEHLWLKRRGRGEIKGGIWTKHVEADLCEGTSIEEAVLGADKKSGTYEILNGRNDGFSVLWSSQIILNTHQFHCLCSGLFSLRHVQVHFVSVKVCIIRVAYTLVQPEGSVWADLGKVRQDTQFVKRRLTVEEHDITIFKMTLDEIALL